jgi:hypothetical protein
MRGGGEREEKRRSGQDAGCGNHDTIRGGKVGNARLWIAMYCISPDAGVRGDSIYDIL